MTWRVALDMAFLMSGVHHCRYRVYSVRRPSGRYRWFICPVSGR